MRDRAEVNAEIIRENRAAVEIQRGTYRWSKTKDRERRDEHIMELWEMGWSREEIAQMVGLTSARISQIVRSFGATFR